MGVNPITRSTTSHRGYVAYEINYGGSTEEIRRYSLFGAMASGNADRFKGYAEECMAEYDLGGWRAPDLSDPGELSHRILKDRK